MTAEPTQALCAVAIGPDLPQCESLAACRAGPPRMRSSSVALMVRSRRDARHCETASNRQNWQPLM